MTFFDFRDKLKKELDDRFIINNPNNNSKKNTFFWIKVKNSCIGTEICHYEFVAVDVNGVELSEESISDQEDFFINLEIHFEFKQKDNKELVLKLLKMKKFLGKKIDYRYNLKEKNQVGIIFKTFNSDINDDILIENSKIYLSKMKKKFRKHFPRFVYKLCKKNLKK